MKNENNFDTAQTIINNLKELGDLFFFGKYTYEEYEYTFYLNGEKIKADDCFSNLFGKNYCKINNTTYNNVDYTETLINQYEKDDFIIGPIFTLSFFGYYITKFFMALFGFKRRY